MYPAQHAAFYARARYVAIDGSTKSGKTQGAIVWQMGLVLSRPGVHWWVAPVYQQTKVAYRRVIKMLPRTTIKRVSLTALEIELTNGSLWQFRSAEKPDNLYGEDVVSAVIDEASRCRNESWIAVRSTLTATGGPIRAIGNVRGRTNWHYQMGRRAEAGDVDHHYAKLTALDAVAGGVMRQAELDDARRVLPDHVFRELYMCEPADDGGNPFGIEAIAQCVGPLSTAPAVVYGLDYARVADWTVLIGLDRHGRVCDFHRFRAAMSETADRVARIVGSTPGYFDATGVGDALVDELRRRRCALAPIVYTSQRKQDMMEALAVALQTSMIGVVDGVLLDELNSFEYAFSASTRRVSFNAPPGSHDDAVNALALAWMAARDNYAMHVARGPQQHRPPVARSVGGRVTRI